MLQRFLSSSLCCIAVALPLSAVAAPISGLGNWESTLQARDFNLDGTADAYYDTLLDLTWLVDASPTSVVSGLVANQWATDLAVGGVTGWRLPKVRPMNGPTFSFDWSCNGTTNLGTAGPLGWGTYSELGHMYYVTLGNKGVCEPNGTIYDEQPGWGLKNTGPFEGLEADIYWTSTVTGVLDTMHWTFNSYNGIQYPYRNEGVGGYTWAVHDGDIFPALSVPEPSSFSIVLIALFIAGANCKSRS